MSLIVNGYPKKKKKKKKEYALKSLSPCSNFGYIKGGSVKRNPPHSEALPKSGDILANGESKLLFMCVCEPSQPNQLPCSVQSKWRT